jgi:hypothetical protein
MDAEGTQLDASASDTAPGSAAPPVLDSGCRLSESPMSLRAWQATPTWKAVAQTETTAVVMYVDEFVFQRALTR